MKFIGVIMLLFGVVGVLYGSLRFAYPDKVMDAGPLELSFAEHENVPVPPLLGALALVGGVVILAAGARDA
jgi:hypothetical protein